MTEIVWTAVSAIAAAIAAIVSLTTVIFTTLDRRRSAKNEVFAARVSVLAKLVLVERALHNAIRGPNKRYINRVRASLYELLRTVGDLGGADPLLLELCGLVEETSCFIDELDFNNFRRDVVMRSLSDLELKFRRIKHDLENEINGKQS